MLDDLLELVPDAALSMLDGAPCVRASISGAEIVVTANDLTLHADLHIDGEPIALVYSGDSVAVCAEAIVVLRELRG